ncbi:hypothetical protein KR018_003097, partial [Drosophila ironensis]
MARRYESEALMFSPGGRLYQVEYAIKAVGQSAPCLGIVSDGGIVMVAASEATDKLMDVTVPYEKLIRINENMVCSFAGLPADATVLINEVRKITERHNLLYTEVMPCEQVVSNLSDIKQSYTQHGGRRPFGVSMIYMGWDNIYGYQLYKSDPAGDYDEHLGVCIGRKSAEGIEMLRQEVLVKRKLKISLEDAKVLAIKVIAMTMSTTTLSPEQVEMGTLKRIEDNTVYTPFNNEEIKALIEKYSAMGPDPEE